MPYMVRKGEGKRPWKIVNKNTGKIVGSSTSQAKAMASARARQASHYGWKPTKNR